MRANLIYKKIINLSNWIFSEARFNWMKTMKKTKKFSSLVVIIGILFVSGLTFANAFRSGGSKLGVPTVLGDEEESDDEKDEVDSDSEDRDGGDEIDKEDDERDNEDEDNDEEKSTEVRRVRTTTQRTTLQNQESDNEDGDQEENDNEDGDENDLQEEIQDLNKDIRKVESKISVLSANGVVVTAFTPVLAEVKSLAIQAQTAVTAKSAEAEILIETADKRLERLEKLVKMTLGDEDENDDDNDAVEEIQDLAKDIAKIEVNLNSASERGVDVSAMKLSLNVVKDLLSQAKDKATAGDLAGAEALTEVADKKLETLKHAMELAFGDDEEDGDEADEYKSEVAQFVHNLKEIGEIEGGIGQQVNVVAQAQNDSIAKVETSIDEINDRGGFVKFLVGPNYGSIAEIQTAITENQTRIKVLTGLVAQVTDPVVKQVLQDQIKNFQQENTRLQTFVTESESSVSLFGWLVKMFS
jgi:hypothetical protein